jgi:hypothetical protein
MVFEQMCLAAKNTRFDGSIVQTGKQTFPDIVANKYYGIEVKITAEDKWVSTGNSVAEGTRVKDIERIYMLFGKLGGYPDIKYRRYQDCLSDVGVTHSPRYKIDMSLAQGSSIFDKLGIKYDILRKEANPIKTIKSYYRKFLSEGEELWWIDNQKEDIVTAKLSPFRKLDGKIRDKFFRTAVILFPEVTDMRFSNKRKYERATAYLIIKYYAFNASFRDLFSAGGRGKVTVKGKILIVPKILFHLYKEANYIKTEIEEILEEDLLYYWKVKRLLKPRLNFWLKLLDQNCDWKEKGLKASDIFLAGLNEKKN